MMSQSIYHTCHKHILHTLPHTEASRSLSEVVLELGPSVTHHRLFLLRQLLSFCRLPVSRSGIEFSVIRQVKGQAWSACDNAPGFRLDNHILSRDHVASQTYSNPSSLNQMVKAS